MTEAVIGERVELQRACSGSASASRPRSQASPELWPRWTMRSSFPPMLRTRCRRDGPVAFPPPALFYITCWLLPPSNAARARQNEHRATHRYSLGFEVMGQSLAMYFRSAASVAPIG